MATTDLEQLLNAMLPFAQQMLEEHGEFYPFGGQVGADGELALVAPSQAPDEPTSQDLIDTLVESLHERAHQGEIRASGICFDVRVDLPNQPERSDAICVQLEQEDGDPIAVFLPYSRGGNSSGLEYGELFAARGDSSVFEDEEDKAAGEGGASGPDLA